MAKKAGFSRTTISVPADLKRRMAKVTDVNWSALASSAFESKLAEIAKAKEKKMSNVETSQSDVDVSAMLVRLRKSKQEHKETVFGRGISDGSEWAAKTADYPELRRLERLVSQQNWEMSFDEDKHPSFGFYFTLYPDEFEGGYSDPFWTDVIGLDRSEDADDIEYLRGFAEGAMEVYSKVKRQL